VEIQEKNSDFVILIREIAIYDLNRFKNVRKKAKNLIITRNIEFHESGMH